MSEIVSSAPRVVVGVDGSEAATQALRWALRIARAEHAGIDVVGAWDFPPNLAWAALPDTYSARSDLEKVVGSAVDEVFGPQRPEYLQILIRQGHPVRVLLDACVGARMLVVGSRGRGGFTGLLMGSVSARVAELARCPVLVVHGEHVAGDQTTGAQAAGAQTSVA